MSSGAKITQKIGFIGSGNMAEAMIKGLLSAKVVDPQQICSSDPRKERCQSLIDRFGIKSTTDNAEVVKHASVVILAVKPQILPKVCDEVSSQLDSSKLVISIAAGMPIRAIEGHFAAKTRIVRAMPNTPALVGAGATALAAGEHATSADLDVAKQIFDAVGKTVALDEDQLDAVTGLSGSGPAYVFLIIEALSDAGVKMGLSRENAQALAAQTVLGSAKLLIDTNEHPGRLKDMVTSPGGTAIAGLHTLEAGGLRTTLINAVEAATRRSRELGEAAANAKKPTGK